MNPEKCLVRSGFMECIVRCAKDKYNYYKTLNVEGENTISKAVARLFNDHIIPYCETIDYNVKSFDLITLKRWRKENL
jgi:hypothetical protein